MPSTPAELQAKIDKLEINMQRFDDWINTPDADIPIDVGVIPSLPKIIDQIEAIGGIELLAPLESPALTGIPTAPTADPGTNTTQLATTAFTAAAVAVETVARMAADELLAPKESPALTGTPTAPTAPVGTETTQVATTAFVGAEAEARIETRITVITHDGDGIPSISFQDEDGFTVGAFPIALATDADILGHIEDTRPVTSAKVAVAINEYISIIEDDSGELPSIAFVDEDGFVIGTFPTTDTAVASADLPDASGWDTLFAYRTRATNILLNSTGILPILITGDSWTERPAITQALKDEFEAIYGLSGYGWISCDASHPLTGLTHSRSGWTLYDASGGAAPPAGIGCAHDGKVIYTTGTTAAETITVQCQSFKIAYLDGDGTFRYRVDGGVAGAWISVVGGETGDVAWLTISGLSDASHTIEIDTTTNTGTVAIYGHIARRSAAGIEFHKCGNGSIDGSQIMNYLDQMDPFLDEIEPALVIIFLGTNDYRRPNAFNTYTNALTGIVENVRAVYPMAGIIFCGPADTDGTAIVPLTDYVSEMHRLSEELGCAFFNDNKLSGTWDQADALGEMADSLHKSDLGGQVTARNLFRTLL